MVEPDPAWVITAGAPLARGGFFQTWYVSEDQWTAIRAILGRDPDEERVYTDEEMIQSNALADSTELPALVRYRPA